jgi:hypothetical protein
MLRAPALILDRLPPAPSLVPVYKTTLTTSTNETTTTWNDVDLGEPHPHRVIVLACYHGVSAVPTVVIHGVTAFLFGPAAYEERIAIAQLPNGRTGTISVSATGSLRKAVSVYVAYPHRHFGPEDANATSVSGTSNATITMRVCRNGGLIFAGCQQAVVGPFTMTWSGAEAVTENVDADSEATSGYVHGMIPSFLTSQFTSTLTLAETVSGVKRLIALPIGPAYGNW